MTTSTSKLNQAIERLSTGSKINHAADNAANYSIATDMSSHISAYNVAADNIAMGMDLVSVAQETISQMQNKAGKLHSLVTQARNGTYGQSSIDAINKEASAIVAEIHRAYQNAEYDGIGMIQKFKPELPDWAKNVQNTAGTVGGKTLEECAAMHNGFIVEVVEETPDVIVTDPTQLADAISSNSKIGIANAETLAKLATIVNSGNDCNGKTIILTEDIDLSAYNNFASIGINRGETAFNGTFNGNGHKIFNLKMNNNKFYTSLIIGYGTVKNLGLENVNIKGGRAGGVATCATIDNCYATGTVVGTETYNAYTGGIAGTCDRVSNCYFIGDVKGASTTGGIVGYILGKTEKCFFEGNVETTAGGHIGGIAGYSEGQAIKNCYSKGKIKGINNVGGLVGYSKSKVQNCYSTADIESTGSNVGGLVGRMQANSSSTYDITSCYATGSVKGKSLVGGLVGIINPSTVALSMVYATGDATATGGTVGGLVGSVGAGTTVTNAQATGNVSAGSGSVGGAFGYVASASSSASKAITLKNVTAYGNVSGGVYRGSLIGSVQNTLNGSTFTAVNVTNCKAVGNDFVGRVCRYNTDTSSTETIDYDTSGWGITAMTVPVTKVTLQTGLYSENTSQISFDLGFNYDLDAIVTEGCTSDSAYTAINNFINTLGQKETELGAITNRLDSALESVYVSMDNLISSRSTIQDADMSKVSSQFIRQQILQQACATLMSTANQSPSIALQLL